MAHKHKDVIVAWANGQLVEFWNDSTGKWDVIPQNAVVAWDSKNQYRIRPPGPRVIVKRTLNFDVYFVDHAERLTWHGETPTLLDAQDLAKAVAERLNVPAVLAP